MTDRATDSVDGLGGIKERSCSKLVELYTDPKILESIGQAHRIAGELGFDINQVIDVETFIREEMQLVKETGEASFLLSNSSLLFVSGFLDRVLELRRPWALGTVRKERRFDVEQEALAEAKKILTEKLSQENLSGDLWLGSFVMVKRIESFLTGEENKLFSRENELGKDL